MEQVIQALSRPVSEMSKEALVLALISRTYGEKDLRSFLEAALVLLLKTEAQEQTPGLADDTAIAMALKHSDDMIMECHYRGDDIYAAKIAAELLLKSLTPLPEDTTAFV